MKFIFTPFLSIFLFLNSYAQKPDSVLARVRYSYTNKNDTLTTGKPCTENMILFVGKNTSLYSSYDKIRHEVSEEQKFRAMIANGGGRGKSAFIMDDTNSKWMTTSTYLFYVKENKLFTKEMIALQSYVVEENNPKINWKISKDTLNFSGLNCQKATANFEGENWTAWYAASLPFQAGPWKLNSLPGLIIEAYNDNKQNYFQFAGIENVKEKDNAREYDVTKQAGASASSFNAIDQLIGRDVGNAYFENIIRLQIGAVKINKQQLEKFKEAFKKDPRGFVKAMSGY